VLSLDETGSVHSGIRTPVINNTMTRKNGKIFATMVYPEAKAAIHCPQLGMNNYVRVVKGHTKKLRTTKNVYPAVLGSVGKPTGKYHTTKYITAYKIAYGISQTMLAVVNANHP
jgi:hypothetical protein